MCPVLARITSGFRAYPALTLIAIKCIRKSFENKLQFIEGCKPDFLTSR